jgi:hypothetical protein
MSIRPSPLTRRRLAWLALGALVTLVHWALGHWWFQQRVGFGMGEVPVKTIDVRFVKELALAPPPKAKATPPAARRMAAPQLAVDARPAASAPEPEPPPARPEPAPTAQLPLADKQALDSAIRAMEMELEHSSAPSSNDSFDWPPSTQLRYTLEGNYRGPLKGWAEVNWLRDGEHYQVMLELRVPPLFARHILSDGVVGPAGLSPRRYDQETEMLLRDTQRDNLVLDEDMVQLANGQRTRSLPGVQDTASQFVQMTWLFLTRPELLQVGGVVEFPLALPRRVVPWRYEVVAQESIHLPFGDVMSFHLRPAPGLSQPGELSVETWVAPELQYLPVRIVVRQNAESFLTLELNGPPMRPDR